MRSESFKKHTSLIPAIAISLVLPQVHMEHLHTTPLQMAQAVGLQCVRELECERFLELCGDNQ